MFYTMSDGSDVSQDTIERLFNLQAFEPVGDGLFGVSQTFTLRARL